MNCPACFALDSIKWEPPRYACLVCGHELTKREYQREIESDYDRWLADPPGPPNHDSEIAAHAARIATREALR